MSACGNSSVVEHNLAKVGVASSNLVSRSSFAAGRTWFSLRSPGVPGWVAEWLCSGLQSRGRRFDSDPSLQFFKDFSPVAAPSRVSATPPRYH